MSTYKMTPAERRARAQAIVKARENRSLYNQYQQAMKLQAEQQEKERLESIWAENDKNSKSWFVRGLSTIGDIAANVITGAVKGLEGIYDLGAGIVGAVGGIFSDDFQDDVQKHIAYDWTSENIGDPMQEWFKYSYTKDGGIVEGVASGIGQMLPAVAITVATGGAGAGSMVSIVGQIASLAYTGVSAAGNATESAYQDGASYYGGLGYGVASGAVEVATEKLFGGATKNVFGKGMLDDVGKSIADTGIKRVAKNALEEGLEEVVAEVANPALKAIYKGKDAFSEYGDGEYWKGVGKAGAIGSLASLAYSGTVGYGLAKRGKGYVGSEADINDSLHEIEGQKKKANNLFANDRLSDENAARITQNLQGNYQNIEKTLKKATPEMRANLIKKFSLESAFEADGTMKADFASTLDFTKQAEAITENGVNGSKNAVASLDRRYINPDLIGQDTKVNETLAVATEGLRQGYMKEHNATHEQAVEAIKDITVFKGELSDKGKVSYSKFKKGLNYLNGVSGHTVNMVVVDEHDSFNGSISDDTIYIGADAFENDSWAEVLVHEYTHFAEGTKEYAKLVHYLRENQELSAKAVKDVFGKGYGFTVEEIEKLYDKFEKGETLTESELQTLTVYESELGAHLTENLLGNESFIDRLVGKETKLAEKVLNKIADLKKMFERIGNAEARAEYKRIKKAEKLYLGAVEKAGYAYINRKIVAPRRREEIDASEEIQYNRKKTPYVQWKSDALAWANSSRTKIGDMDSGSDSRYIYFYEAFDPDNDGRATDYRVVAKVSFANKKLIDEWEAEVKANNERNYAKRSNTIVYESVDEYASTRKEYNGDNATFVEQSSRNGRVGEVHQGKPEGDGKRNTQKGDGSGQGVKYYFKEGKLPYQSELSEFRYSLKDSQGRMLTKAQAEFFANSKARDKDGNLCVVYHGTEGEFYTFDKTYRGTVTGAADAKLGFFFTTNKNVALEYAIEAYDNKVYNLRHKIAQGDHYLLELLGYVEGYKELAATEDVTEYGRLIEKGERFEHDIYKLYLNIINPLEVDFEGKPYKKGAMLKLVTRALTEGRDGVIIRNMDDTLDFSGEISDVFVAFEPNQIKLTTNKSPTNLDDIRYSLKANINEYTEKQYNDFGWARVNGVLTAHENADFRSKYAKIKSGQIKAIRTKNGEIIVAVNDGVDGSFGVDNVLVYSKDPVDNYKIVKVVKIVLDDETSIDIVRSKIYEIETDRRKYAYTASELIETYFGKEIVSEYAVGDFASYQEIKAQRGRQDSRNESGGVDEDYQREQIGSGNLGENQGNVSFSLKSNQIRAIESRGVKGDSLLNAIDLAEEIFAVNGEITDDGKAIVYHATSLENAHKIIESGKMFGKEDNLFFSTKADGEILGYGDSIVEAQIPLEKLQLNDVFAEEVHLTMSVKPNTLTNIRFSLKDKYFYRLTDGQVKKAVANYTKFKVYSKVDAESIINNVLGNYMSFGESYGVISGKTKNEVIEMLWRGLNTAEPGRQAKVALDIAEYILQNAVLENIYEDDSNQVYIDTIQVLKPYLHSIKLNGIKGDIKHKYDRDNSPYLLWGKRKEHGGKGADVIAMELEEQGFYIDGINEADIFFQIDTAYREAVAALKKQAKELLDSSLSKEERYELKQQIAKEILRGFDYQGKPSKLADIAKTYSDKAKFWKDKYYDERKRNTVINSLLDRIQAIKEDKLNTFLNASQFDKNEIFKDSILKLSNIKYRGNLNKSGTRKIVAGLQEWYSEKNPMLENEFDGEIASMLEDIATGEGDLSTTELRALTNVVDYFKHFIETYNKVYRNGRYVDAQPIVEKYIGILQANKSVKVGWLRKFCEKYITTFADPMTVARYMDRYSDGFYSEQLESLRKGAIGAGVMEMEMREPLEEFYKKHKKFLKTLKDKTVTYQGTEIPLSQAMLLYMSLNREQAILGLARSGFAYADKDGKITRLNGFAVEEGLEIDEIRVIAKEVQKGLVSQFTETEMEYISIAEKLFNEDCKEAKRKTDMDLRGYTNALDDYYVPIRRYVVGKSVDTETYLDEIARVSNASFNKDTVKGAKNELFLGTLEGVLDRHIRAVSLYANLALPLREYDILYNLDTAGNPNKPISVKTEGVNAWANGEKYFQKLVKDIQGIPASDSIINKTLSQLRGGYAKYQLGANPKVWATQFSSFGAAGSMLDVDSIIKGMAIKTDDVDEYCALAKLRNNENSAALAQGVLEKTGKIGDILMKPIGMVDRLVVKKLFGACQVQVEKNGGAKVGTKENKVEAGKLLEKVILETQQNAIATERSAAMRDGNEIMKTLTMFSADSMKVIGRVIDSIGEVAVLKAKRKNATDPSEIASLDKKIKAATKQAGRSIASLVSTAAFMALIAQGFRWLYNKDDEDKNIIENMTVDVFGNLLGGLPLFRDIYSFYAEGYDLDNYAYSTVNDLLQSGQDVFDLVGSIFEGATDSREVAASVKKAAYAGGQLLGIPTRNIYNFVYGLTKRFSPSTAYKIDDMFYNQNYSSDLAKAIKNEDEEMIATIVGVMLDEKIGGIENSSVRNELDDLTKKGFSVLPRSVGSSITYEGEKIGLTSGQAKSFKEVYSVANEALASLVGLSQYKSATDEVKAKAINSIWDIYYNLAVEEVLGVDIESKAVLFAEAIDIEKLAIIIATARAIEADTDKNGKSISGTRKAKIQKYVASLKLTAVQKYMVMGYLGYTNKNGKAQVKAYINRLNLSKTEKEKLLAYSGY